jgi:hypothetical protein
MTYQLLQKLFAISSIMLLLLVSQTISYSQATAKDEPRQMSVGVSYVSRDWNDYLEYNQTTLEDIKDHGFNIIRLVLYWKAYNPEPGIYDKNAYNNLISILDWTNRNQIQTILEFHFSFYLHPDPTLPDWLGREQNRYAENFLFNDTSIAAFLEYEHNTLQSVKQYASYIQGVELNEPFFVSNTLSLDQETIVDFFKKWLKNQYQSTSILNETWARQPLGPNEKTFEQVKFPVPKDWYSPRWVDYYNFVQTRYLNITKDFDSTVVASLPTSRAMVSYNEGIWWTGVFYSDENTQAVYPQQHLSARALHSYPSQFGNLNNTLNMLKMYFDGRLFTAHGGQTLVTETAAKHPGDIREYQNTSSVLRTASMLLKAQPEAIIVWNAIVGKNDSFSIFYPDGTLRNFGKAWSWIAKLQPQVTEHHPDVLVIMPTIGTPLWYNYFSSTFSSALALYESGVDFDIWVGPVLPENKVLSKYRAILIPDSMSFNETWAKTSLKDYVQNGGSLFIGRGQQVGWSMRQTTPSADSFYYFSNETTNEKSLENTEQASIASNFYDLKAGTAFNFTFHDVAYFPKGQELGSNVDAIIKDSNGDNLALRATYGNGKVLFFGGWADFAYNIDGYVTLIHSFLKWGGIIPEDHKLQSPNLLDSGWIALKNGGKVRIISNIGSSLYYADEQYPVLPGRTIVLADQNSTLQDANFVTSDPNISMKMISPSSPSVQPSTAAAPATTTITSTTPPAADTQIP